MKRILAGAVAVWMGCFAARAGEIVFASYNVENYLLRAHDSGAPKPEKQIAALIRIIQEIHPDILGVCEMGTRADFADFKTRLKDAALGFSDDEYVEAADTERHLALLSRWPIVARQSLTDVAFSIDGRPEKVKRGFLDVTIKCGAEEIRVVGVHLKSKREVAENEELVRRHEAHLLRIHLDELMTQNENAKLLVYGDFNDAKNSPALQEISGPRSLPHYLTDLPLQDSVGDRWTEFWKATDLYSRLDYIFVNHALLSRVVPAQCCVYRSDHWNDASDHRPVVVAIRVEP